MATRHQCRVVGEGKGESCSREIIRYRLPSLGILYPSILSIVLRSSASVSPRQSPPYSSCVSATPSHPPKPMSSSPDDVPAEIAGGGDAAACEPLACTTCRSRKLKCKLVEFRHLAPQSRQRQARRPRARPSGLFGRLRLTHDSGDRLKPACSRCSRINSECLYPEARRKPAFKRRNVKELEERLGTSTPSHVPLF